MTVQVSLPAKSVSGSSVKLVGPPLTVAACEPLAGQLIVNHVPLTVAGSLNVMPMFVLRGTFAPDGNVEATVIW